MNFRRRSPRRKQFTCSKCGEKHHELPALTFDYPYHYYELDPSVRKKISEIDTDFCVIRHKEQTDRFIRTNLVIQINDACEDLNYGIWTSVSAESYEDYKSEFTNNTAGKHYFGRICNLIPDYEVSTLGIHVSIQTQSNGIRPDLIPYESNHPLVLDWLNGITIEEALKRIGRIENAS